jgi:hypothetical protein
MATKSRLSFSPKSFLAMVGEGHSIGSTARARSPFHGDRHFTGRPRGCGPSVATVAAMTDSVIVCLEKAAIVRGIRQEPAFRGVFVAHLLRSAIRVAAGLADQLLKRLAGCGC